MRDGDEQEADQEARGCPHPRGNHQARERQIADREARPIPRRLQAVEPLGEKSVHRPMRDTEDEDQSGEDDKF